MSPNKEISSLDRAIIPISYELKLTRRCSTMEIRVNSRGAVKVLAPYWCRKKEIKDFIHSRSQWILRQVDHMKRENGGIINCLLHPGAHLFFLGSRYPLVVEKGEGRKTYVEFDGARWVIRLCNGISDSRKRNELKKGLKKWFKDQAEELLGGRVFQLSRRMGVLPKRVSIRQQKSIWGSCNAHLQSLNLNWKIIMAPFEVIDYLIIHELCHLRIPNHSQRFWQEIKSFAPDYQKQQKWLKDHSRELALLDDPS